MATAFPLMFAVIAVISFTASAQEVAFSYGDSGERPLESGNISEYNGTDVVTSSIASAADSSGTASQISTTSVDDIEREINLKINMDNRAVMDKASSLVLDYPGDGTIGQICSIYEYMVSNWSYKRDPRGIEIFQYSNQSLEYGNGKYSGQGDCDDFSILQASLVESIGCTSRIVLAYGLNSGHAYTEVYLGKAGGPESDTGRMIAWLKKKYRVNEINYHTDLKTGDVWLNLDWWKESGGAKHPGGPLYMANKQVPIWIREDVAWDALKPMNEPPIAQLSVSPMPPVVGEIASFNASKSRDIGGRVESYLWDFGDGNKTERTSEPVANHVYLKGGPCTVKLTVWDGEDATNSSIQNMMINNPPQANFTIEPQRPKVGDQIKFDASCSWDAEDGRNLAYNWVINNNSAIFSQASPPRQVYDEAGKYWINLTVSDTNGAVGHKNYLLKINQPPIARIAVDNTSLSLGKIINFSAELSEDPDGEIISYTWDFGDNSTTDGNKTAFHRYHDGGVKTVRLSVRDDDGAISNITQEISINHPPIAMFTIDPEKPKKGEVVSFNASASYDPDGKIITYLWDFGVGRVEPEAYKSEYAEHTYNSPKKYNVTLTVQDNNGFKTSVSKLIDLAEKIGYISDGQEYHTIFEDDFSVENKGWLSITTDLAYTISRDPEKNNVIYHTSRGSMQEMHHSVSSKVTDFELSIDAVLDEVNENGFVWIGLTGNIVDLDWYWKGLGFNINHYDGKNFAQVIIEYNDGSMYSSISDDKILPLQNGIWYTYKLSKNGTSWKLQQYDRSNKELLGTIEGTINKSLPSFNYILFGNGDESQWETAKGRLDNVNLSTPENYTVFEDDFSDGSLSEWDHFGDPSPRIVASMEGRSGIFDNNGDASCDSGISSKEIFSLPNGFVLESDILMDVTDTSGCWNDAMFGLLKNDSLLECEVPMGLLFRIRYDGDACWQSKVDKRGHAYLDGGFYTDDGVWESIGAYVNGDAYVDGWHNFKVVVQKDRYVKFYVDSNLIYASVNKIDQKLLKGKRLFVDGRSSGSAGKVYHDYIRLQYALSQANTDLTPSE